MLIFEIKKILSNNTCIGQPKKNSQNHKHPNPNNGIYNLI